ncbi:uncharacterized protein LOC108667601 [Hyalella azteca]|uniref:Uncharacterized protein LOC108667601 n=1 Tax=Hyalella azteca TaxID=294128 RepID=A0A8B7N9M2_HYAAZ|nr:uncharacterized protein LOC108667601 [Hyalella azteca]
MQARIRRLLRRCWRRTRPDSAICQIDVDGTYHNPRGSAKTPSYALGNTEFYASSDDPDLDWALELSMAELARRPSVESSSAGRGGQEANSTDMFELTRRPSVGSSSAGRGGQEANSTDMFELTRRPRVGSSSAGRGGQEANSTDMFELTRGYDARSIGCMDPLNAITSQCGSVNSKVCVNRNFLHLDVLKNKDSSSGEKQIEETSVNIPETSSIESILPRDESPKRNIDFYSSLQDCGGIRQSNSSSTSGCIDQITRC